MKQQKILIDGIVYKRIYKQYAEKMFSLGYQIKIVGDKAYYVAHMFKDVNNKEYTKFKKAVSHYKTINPDSYHNLVLYYVDNTDYNKYQKEKKAKRLLYHRNRYVKKNYSPEEQKLIEFIGKDGYEHMPVENETKEMLKYIFRGKYKGKRQDIARLTNLLKNTKNHTHKTVENLLNIDIESWNFYKNYRKDI